MQRRIKPGFFTNETVARLPVLARLLYQALWFLADRHGRLQDRPKRIKVQTLPYDDVDIDAALDQLAGAGLLQRFEEDGQRWIRLHEWETLGGGEA